MQLYISQTVVGRTFLSHKCVKHTYDWFGAQRKCFLESNSKPDHKGIVVLKGRLISTHFAFIM